MKAKREAKIKKKLSDCMDELLSAKVAEQEDEALLKSMGIPATACNNRMLVMAKLLERAIGGEIPAIKEVRAIVTETESKDTGLLQQIIEAVKQVG